MSMHKLNSLLFIANEKTAMEHVILSVCKDFVFSVNVFIAYYYEEVYFYHFTGEVQVGIWCSQPTGIYLYFCHFIRVVSRRTPDKVDLWKIGT